MSLGKLLFHTNAPWACTGYGQQCATFAPRLRDAGYDVALSAFYGLQGGTLSWQDMIVYPNARDAYGNDIINGHAGHHAGGDVRDTLVLSLIDVWVLNTAVWRTLNTCAWVPVDHDPVPHLVADYFRQSAAIPIAMSRFGQQQLSEFDALYVPHGIDTTALAPGDKTAAKEKLGLPTDRFIVGMVAANKGNPSRKSFSEAFQAFAGLVKAHDDCHLYLHTEALGTADGINLPRLLASIGIGPDRVTFADQYRYQCVPTPTSGMCDVFNAIDVLLSASMGEGFCVPLAEAQACGTPVITSDFSAMPEVGEVGWNVSGTRSWTYQESWQITPSVEELIWALKDAYDRAPTLADAARQHALKYDADLVLTEHFLPALAEVQNRLEARAPQTLAAA